MIGFPLGHSLSAALHNAALGHFGIDGVYLALPVQPEQLPGAVAGIRAFRLAGVNVTVPHKVSICQWLDGLLPRAQTIGAANTLFWQGDRLLGDNTDITGYEAMLTAGSSHVKTALVLGAGGSARAVCTVLLSRSIDVRVSSRRFQQAQALCEEIGPCAHPIPWPEIADGLKETDLVVNTTPLGMSPQIQFSPLGPRALARLPQHAAVHDLVYNPRPTRLLTLASDRGLRTVDGSVMLLAQAAEAFWRWTGLVPPPEVLSEAYETSQSNG